MKKFSLLFLIGALLVPFPKASASWAFPCVVYSGILYEVLAGEAVPANEIDKRIGKVTKYSDREGTYRGNFSNIYPKGTAYYSIKGQNPKDTIAIQTQADTYVKAVSRGAYAYGGMETTKLVWTYVMIGVLSILLFTAAVIFMRRRRKMGA